MVRSVVECICLPLGARLPGDKDNRRQLNLVYWYVVKRQVDISFSSGQREKYISFSYGQTIRDILFSCGHYHVLPLAVKDL